MSHEHLPNCPPRFDSDMVRPYWDGLKEGRLLLPACSQCGKWQWYPHEFVTCHPEAHHQWIEVSSVGRVYTFTRVHRSFLPGAVRGAAPYVSILVEPEGIDGVRIPSVLVNTDDQSLAVGMRVALHPIPRDGYLLPAYIPIE